MKGVYAMDSSESATKPKIEPYPTPEQWRQYYLWYAGECGGEVPIGYPSIIQWKCECGTENATVEGERRRCVNKDCNVVRLK